MHERGAAMTSLLLWLSFLVLSLLEHKSFAEDETVVVTSSGPVRGKHLPAGSRNVTAYLGIPYAEPPVGKLRFQKPVPHTPWSHILEATNFGNSCPQVVISGTPDAAIFNANTPHSEDCLFLNVWVPHPRPSTPAAVLVWIYGGGFFFGTASLVIYNGAFLAATENVVVVSMNYRLGALGFLSLPPAAPGNVGLLDQQLALRWVRGNAAAFGGDPTRITIFGESAGGVSVNYHLLSPGSQSLFDRAVVQSGTAIAPWAWISPEEAKRRALALAKQMGCTEAEDRATVNCLQGKRMEEFPKYTYSVAVLNLPFVPTTDGDFLPDDPQKLVESRRFQSKPIMIGTTSDEGSMFVFYAAPFLHALTECLLTWEQLLEGLKMNVRNATEEFIQSIALRYSEAEPGGPARYRSALSQAWGDYLFVCPANEIATETAKTGSPVYAYTFTHRSVGSVWPEWMGSSHESELPYLFGTLTLLPGTNVTHTEAELELIPRVMRYWAEFARSSNPTPSDVNETKWPLYNPAEQNFFHISTEPPQVMKPSPAQHCSLWKALLSRILCESLMDSCQPNPCLNGGSCQAVPDSPLEFTCHCPQGYDGTACDLHALPCGILYCHNGGVCISHPSGPQCLCSGGFSGPDCRLPPCSSGSCPAPNTTVDCQQVAGDGRCDRACSSLETRWDGGDCSLGVLDPWENCPRRDLCWMAFRDGQCHRHCDNEDCLFDGYDCSQQMQCNPVYEQYCRYHFSDGHCDRGCDTALCGWDGGDCWSASTEGPGLGLVVLLPQEGLRQFLRSLAVALRGALQLQRDLQGRERIYPYTGKEELGSSSNWTGTEEKAAVETIGYTVFLAMDGNRCSGQCPTSPKSALNFLGALAAKGTLESLVPYTVVDAWTESVEIDFVPARPEGDEKPGM